MVENLSIKTLLYMFHQKKNFKKIDQTAETTTMLKSQYVWIMMSYYYWEEARKHSTIVLNASLLQLEEKLIIED